MNMPKEKSPTYFNFSIKQLITIAALLSFIIAVFFDGLEYMVRIWETREEYSHGYLIPLMTLFFIWLKKDLIENAEYVKSWGSVALVAVGLVLLLVGELATIYTIQQYAFILTISGILWALWGTKGFMLVAVPLLILIFMIPLPNFIYNNLSLELQLLSSKIGVAVIRAFGISVYLEGNVIDLGTYKLQVVDACSGLRYLFPLMSFAFICAYIFSAPFWMRTVVFLSSIPITILMNSFRIGVIGLLVEYYGIGAAEGFLHDFEGWIIFIACLGILFIEVWLLTRFFLKGKSFSEVFVIDFPNGKAKSDKNRPHKLPMTFWVSSALVVLTFSSQLFIVDRDELLPDRQELASFPSDIDKWQGKNGRIEDLTLRALKLTDYVIVDYANNDDKLVNFYVAYYQSQRKGESAHSPKSCIPGGGWQIKNLSQKQIEPDYLLGRPLDVNRLVIQFGDTKQLVYYWFQQRGRVITNEYLVKWYILWDSITKNRTDGALVRLTTVVKAGESLEEADETLSSFARSIASELPTYIPN